MIFTKHFQTGRRRPIYIKVYETFSNRTPVFDLGIANKGGDGYRNFKHQTIRLKTNGGNTRGYRKNGHELPQSGKT